MARCPDCAKLRADDSQGKIQQRQHPEACPIRPNFGQARPHLVDPDHAVDRIHARQKLTQLPKHTREGLRGPGDADQEELRQTTRKDQQHRGLAMAEQLAKRLSEKARRQDERDRERSERPDAA